MAVGAEPRWSKSTWTLAALLALSALLRLGRLDLVPVTADEGSHIGLAMGVATGVTSWPLAGLPSLGVRNSALFISVLTLAELTWWHPLTAAAVVGGLNVLAAWLCWRLAARHLGQTAATVSLALWACSPWAVLYARMAWPPSCLAVVSLLLIDAGLGWLADGSRRRLAWLMFLVVTLPQVHFSGFCAAGWVLVVLWQGRHRIAARPLAAGLAAGLAAWTPWIIFHARNGLGSGGLGRLGGHQGLWPTLVESVNWLAQLVGGSGTGYWFGDPFDSWNLDFPRWLPLLVVSAAVVVLAVSLVAVARTLLSPTATTPRLLLLWVALPLAGLLILRPQVHPHYLLIALPVPFLLIGWIAERLVTAVPTTRFHVIAGTSVICATWLLLLGGWYRYVDDDQPVGDGHFRLSYRQRLDTVEFLLKQSDRRSRIELAGSFNGTNPRYEFIYRYRQHRVGHDRYPVDPDRKYWVEARAEERIPASGLIDRVHASLGDPGDAARGWSVEWSRDIGPTSVSLIRRRDPVLRR